MSPSCLLRNIVNGLKFVQLKEELFVCMLVRRHHSSSSSTTQGGMNPSFLFLQVFESQVLQRKLSHEPDNSLLSLPSNEVTSC